MHNLLILLALNAATPDATAFARCAEAARKIHICHEGRGSLIFVNGGYSTRLGFLNSREYKFGGAVCQPGTGDECEWAPDIMNRRPKAWAVERTELVGQYRYCLTKRPIRGHLPIGCLTRATNLSFRRMNFDDGQVS